MSGLIDLFVSTLCWYSLTTWSPFVSVSMGVIPLGEIGPSGMVSMFSTMKLLLWILAMCLLTWVNDPVSSVRGHKNTYKKHLPYVLASFCVNVKINSMYIFFFIMLHLLTFFKLCCTDFFFRGWWSEGEGPFISHGIKGRRPHQVSDIMSSIWS